MTSPKQQNMPDEFYMNRALTLARRGAGWTSPNPMVGCVIVKNGAIIGEGYHRKFGGPHAEINAIRSATMPLKGASIYVTLEPCTHYGKTPPCIDSVLAVQPAEVIIGTLDPNPQVAGRSIDLLKRAGIRTRPGVLEASCRELNEKFFKFMQTLTPFVTIKFAQSLDGRTATAIGDSKWISSEPSLKLAHRERALHDAILVGIGTVLADDPELTVRRVRGRNPIRIVLDPRLRIPPNSKVLQDQGKARTIIVTKGDSKTGRKAAQLSRQGIEVLSVKADKGGKLDLAKLLKQLGKKGISSLLVEGGSKTATLFLKQGLADRLLAVTAPRLIGTGINAVGDLGIKYVQDAILLDYRDVFRSGDDIVVDARLHRQGR